jgi:glycosyltransferase involved in cell wall biosynthesis
LNEESNISDCILSARELVDEIVVVDMSSDDRTVEIAKSCGAVVYIIERRPFVDPTRNYAIAKATDGWILLLDADEQLTPELTNELYNIAENDKFDTVTIYRDTYMFGRRIRYSGWQGDRHCRFFKKGFVKFTDQEVHYMPEVHGRHMILPSSKGRIQHYNYQDIRHFISKMNDYTDGEALKLLRSDGKISPFRGVYWGIYNFYKRFVKLKGFKDGKYGFILSVLMGFYWFLAFIKAWEQKNKI